VVPVPPVGAAALRLQVTFQKRLWRGRGDSWDPSSVPLAMHRALAAYPMTSVAPTVSMNLSRALARAGVDRPGVRPRSLREYAANRTYAMTGRVEDVAHLLGLTSFDTAFHYVDPGWQDAWGPVIRNSDPQSDAEHA
jgi:hypothetical protein